MEQRLFEDLLDSDKVAHRTAKSKTLPVSLALHVLAAALIVVLPILAADTMPEPASAVKAFFVEPMSAPAPPPPPPPPAPAQQVVHKIQPKPVPQESKFVAPVDIPQQIKPEESLDLGVQGGVSGGVEGGVPGGVVGGIVGGLPDTPPTPAVKPVRVGGDVREPKKVVEVAPEYPDLALKAGVQGIVIIEATIDARGRVAEAKVLRSVPMLDEAALDAVRKWVYTPTLLGGVPTPVIMTLTVNFQLKRQRA